MSASNLFLAEKVKHYPKDVAVFIHNFILYFNHNTIKTNGIFKFYFRRKKGGSVIGIDIGSSSIKVVQLKNVWCCRP